MAKLFNLARMTTASTGTGPITLGAAVPGYLTFAQAGVLNGDVIDYAIKDGSNSEIGTGTYTTSGTTFTRSVTKSTNSNAAISLSGTAEVFITPRAETLADASSLTSGVLDPARIGGHAITQDKILYGGPSQPGTLNLNNAFTAGFYAGTGYLNSPDGVGATSNYWYILIQQWDNASYTSQIAVPLSGQPDLSAIWTRTQNGGTWSAWRKSYHQSNILGAVSVSAGVPTGALIERNSNANGSYVRFADGTQICWRTAVSGLTYSGMGFAAAFASTDYSATVTAIGAPSIVAAGLSNFTTTLCNVAVAGSSNQIVAVTVIGKWF